MPACAVEHKDHLLAWPGSHRIGERRQLDREHVGAHCCRQLLQGAARGGMSKGDHVAPLVAWFDAGERLRAAPHLTPALTPTR